MKQPWFPVGHDLMQGELSPFKEQRPLTKFEAMMDLTHMAIQTEDWTVHRSLRKLVERWKWKHHEKVRRFLHECEEMGIIRCDKGETEVCHRMCHITVIPPSGYTGGRAAKRDKNVPKVSQPHINREKDIRDKSVFSDQHADSDSELTNPNPQLERSGGVSGIVPPWDLQRLAREASDNND